MGNTAKNIGRVLQSCCWQESWIYSFLFYMQRVCGSSRPHTAASVSSGVISKPEQTVNLVPALPHTRCLTGQTPAHLEAITSAKIHQALFISNMPSAARLVQDFSGEARIFSALFFSSTFVAFFLPVATLDHFQLLVPPHT